MQKAAEWVRERVMARALEAVGWVKKKLIHGVHHETYGYGAVSLSGEPKTLLSTIF